MRRRLLAAEVGLSLTLLGFAAGLTALAWTGVPARAQTADDRVVCSLDGSRSSRPFATSSEYTRLRASLLDGANFGPGGIVPVTITIRAGASTISAATLAGCDAFMVSDMTSVPAQGELSALRAAVVAGMVLIADGDSVGGTEVDAVHAILSALDGSSLTGGSACPGSSTGGTLSNANNPATNGPFGDLRGASFGTTPSSTVGPAAGDETVVSCADTAVRMVIPPGNLGAGSGLVLAGGDPSALDLFTTPAGSAFNPSNEKLYLNAIAAGAVAEPTPEPPPEPPAEQPPAQSPPQQTPQQQPPPRDPFPPDIPTADSIDQLPDPEPFEEVNIEAAAGTVFVRLPGGRGGAAHASQAGAPSGFIPLTQAAHVPVGSIVEASRGRISLESTADARGLRAQRADFYAGRFKIRQPRARRPVTEMVLEGGNFRGCGRAATSLPDSPQADASRRRGRRVRRVWGNGRGRFRTRGRYSSATVRGTTWLTEDHCNGTLTRVARRPRTNRLLVEDHVQRRSRLLRAGQSYFAARPLRRP